MFGEDAVDSDEESLLAEAREITKSLSRVNRLTLSEWYLPHVLLLGVVRGKICVHLVVQARA